MRNRSDSPAVYEQRLKAIAKYEDNIVHEYFCGECQENTYHYIFNNPIPGIGTSFNCKVCDNIPTFGAVASGYEMRHSALMA